MAYDFSRVKVLAADGNSRIRDMLDATLRIFGFRHIDLVADGTAALEAMRRGHHDLLIIDWSLRPTDGLSLTRMVRTSSASGDRYVPIIMMAADADLGAVRQARDYGVTEFMAKPFTASSLYDRLAEVVERPRPFVETTTYFGPDRRRRNEQPTNGNERRHETAAMCEALWTPREVTWP